ncbi:MAG: NAD(+)/NADH kinase [Bacteriovoracaceae bacterium]
MKTANIKTIGITLKPNSTPEFYNILPNLCSWLIRRKKQVVFREEEKDRIAKFFRQKSKDGLLFWNSKNFHNDVDLMLSLGGDGTLIGVCRRINSKIPVLGINLGRLGFITEFNKNEYFDHLNDIIDGKYKVTTKPLYHVSVTRKNKAHFEDYFFNDAVLAKNDIARMIYLRAEFRNEHIYNLSGDGIIISSPLGSTAYSMAAGGPIVHPEVKALILTPICPHSLIHRPFVIPDNAPITLKILPPHHSVTLTLDGQVAVNLDEQDVVIINDARTKKVNLIKNVERFYFETIRDKFIISKKD